MSEPVLGTVLEAAVPVMAPSEASRLAAEHFGIVGAVVPLTSERDLNFRIGPSGQRYVLKLANPAEDVAVTRFQTEALLHLGASGLPVPRVVLTRAGATEVVLPQGVLRLLTYLEGVPQHMTPRSLAQSRSLAQMAARLSRALAGFSHPAAHHVLQWDIKHAATLRPMLPAIGDEALRALAARMLDRFDALAPRLPGLRWQVVHNDLNPHNVLVQKDDPDEIVGVLDFGDMVHTPLICDAAIAAAYCMDPEQPLESVLNFARAYHKALPLTAAEAEVFPDLVATRMVTTLAIASVRAARYPDNAAYILRNVASARDGLLALSGVPAQTLKSAMGAL